MAIPKPMHQSPRKPSGRSRGKMFAMPPAEKAGGDPLASLSENDIRQKAGSQSFEKGYAYFRSEAVYDLYRVDRTLQGMVAGSGVVPYRVRIQLGPRQIEQLSCTCPHPAEYCKHVVAVLLTLVHKPELLQVAPSLEAELRRLSKQDLTDLLLQLQQQEPELGYRIYRELTRPAAGRTSSPASLRRLEKTVRDRLAVVQTADPALQYEPGSVQATLDIAGNLLEEIRTWLNAGQPEAALAMLGPLSEALLPDPSRYLDAYGSYAHEALLEDIGQLWVQILLLSSDQGESVLHWLPQLRSWQRRLGGYGLGAALHPVLSLLEAGETLELLHAAIRGEVEPESWARQSDEEIDRLARLQLQLLRQQGQRAEALNLARASGQHTDYALLLIEQGEAEAAVAYLLERLSPSLDLLTICGSLVEHGIDRLALKLGAQALDALASNYRLTVWLRDTAAARAEQDLARHAAWRAVLQQAHLEDFLRLKALYGSEWLTCQHDFLHQLRQAFSAWPPQMIDILMAEDQDQEAMQIASRFPQDSAAVQRVVSALLTREPAWSRQACIQQAEQIMDSGESRSYADAIHWLKLVRQASFVVGEEEGWKEYLDQLISRHHRKYALRPMLEKLR
ncbi:MAG: SWIM zinc finger domain-containing protein [Candidatus Sericytochromatia bacterium]